MEERREKEQIIGRKKRKKHREATKKQDNAKGERETEPPSQESKMKKVFLKNWKSEEKKSKSLEERRGKSIGSNKKTIQYNAMSEKRDRTSIPENQRLKKILPIGRRGEKQPKQ